MACCRSAMPATRSASRAARSLASASWFLRSPSSRSREARSSAISETSRSFCSLRSSIRRDHRVTLIGLILRRRLRRDVLPQRVGQGGDGKVIENVSLSHARHVLGGKTKLVDVVDHGLLGHPKLLRDLSLGYPHDSIPLRPLPDERVRLNIDYTVEQCKSTGLIDQYPTEMFNLVDNLFVLTKVTGSFVRN